MASSSSALRAFACPPTALRLSGSRVGSCLRISVSAPALRPRSSVFSSWSRDASTSRISARRSRSRARLARRSRMSEGLLRDLRQLFKCRRVPHRDVGEHLAIDLHARLPQPVHQAVVGELVQPGRRVDARDPEPAEIALLPAPVPIRVLLGALDRLLGGFPQFGTPAPVALGELHDLVLAREARDVALDARHGVSLRLQQTHQALLIRVRNHRALPEAALPLGMFLGQDVALEGSVAPNLSRTRSKELREGKGVSGVQTCALPISSFMILFLRARRATLLLTRGMVSPYACSRRIRRF